MRFSKSSVVNHLSPNEVGRERRKKRARRGENKTVDSTTPVLGRGSNYLGRGNNDLGREMLKYELSNP